MTPVAIPLKGTRMTRIGRIYADFAVRYRLNQSHVKRDDSFPLIRYRIAKKIREVPCAITGEHNVSHGQETRYA